MSQEVETGSSWPVGRCSLEVTFRDGPKDGESEQRLLEFLPEGRLIQLQPPFPAAGDWTLRDGRLSFNVFEVVLGDDLKPSVVVHVACRDASFDAAANVVEGDAKAQVYAAGDDPVATLRVSQRGEMIDNGRGE
ncbi:MAG: hypothetical protein JST08_09550 [Actinobacteria bacterium]|nr:hypothetical protein [Actinomycetota bacterium]